MDLYEFINPSDITTFKAKNDKIAYVVTIIIGKGNMGCKNLNTGISLHTMLMFSSNAQEEVEEYLGSTLVDFVESNIEDVAKAMESFAYIDFSEREDYDMKIESFDNPELLENFKKSFENDNRTSMNRWVLSAWNHAKNLMKNYEK